MTSSRHSGQPIQQGVDESLRPCVRPTGSSETGVMSRVARWLGVVGVVGLGLSGGVARAAISSQSPWASQFAGTTTYPSGTVNASYAVAAGSGRLLVVAIAATQTAAGAITCSASYGGTALTLAAGDGTSTATWNHSYLYYMKDTPALMDGTGRALAVTCTGGTAYASWVYAAVYAGVNQTTPITDAKNYNGGGTGDTAVGPFSPALTINANDQAIEIVNEARISAGTTARTITTWAAGWPTTPGVAPAAIITRGQTAQLYIQDRNVLTAASDGSQHTASNTAWDSMTAMSMQVAPAGTVTVAAGTNPTNSSISNGGVAALDAFTLTVAGGTASVSSVSFSLTGNTSASNVFVNSTQACTGTTYGTYASPGTTGTISTTGLSPPVGTTPLYLCMTASPTAGSVTGYASTVASN